MRLGSRVDGHAAGFKEVLVLVPDEMLPGLTPACCRRSATAIISAGWVAIPLPPRPFTLRPMTLSMGTRRSSTLRRVGVAGVGGDGAVEQVEHALLVRLRARSVQRRIAGDHDFGLAVVRAVHAASPAKPSLRASSPCSTAPVAACFRKSLRLVHPFLAFMCAAGTWAAVGFRVSLPRRGPEPAAPAAFLAWT